jgi:parallel beta-helix repeat protein
VTVRSGSYVGFYVESINATAARPLVFRAEPGARISAPGPLPSRPPLNTATYTHVWPLYPHAITIQRSSHVIIDGFELTGMPGRTYDNDGNLIQKGGSGIYAEASRFLTFRHNNSHDNGRWGMFTAFCDDTLIEDNVAANSGTEHGIYLSNSGDRAVVRRNVFSGNNQAGLQINADNTYDSDDYRLFAYPDGVSSHNVIEDNVIRDNGLGGAAGLNFDGVSDSLITRNVITNNHATGIALFQDNGRTGSQRNLVTDNWISMAADGRWGLLTLGCQPQEIDGNNHCTDADVPTLPEWTQRPPAFASGSTGNIIVRNVVLSASVENGSLYTDHLSLKVDDVSGKKAVSNQNLLANRFAINSDTEDFVTIVMDILGWRTQTGLDQHSVVVPAAQ